MFLADHNTSVIAMNGHQVNSKVSDARFQQQLEPRLHKSSLLLMSGLIKETPENSHALPGHKVRHLQILNNKSLWLLMGACVLFVGAGVMSMEIDSCKENDLKRQEIRAGQAQSSDASDIPSHQGLLMHRILNLLACVIGLNVAMLFWGISQEFIVTNLYVDSGTEEHFPSSLFLVLTNRLCSAFFCGLLAWVNGRTLLFPGFKMGFLPALSNLLASYCQYSSLSYISFPLQTTAKSAKLLPVLIFGELRGKRQSIADYAEALVISCALIVFGLETDSSAGFQTAKIGVLLLVGLMIFDSVTPHLQERMYEKDSDLSVIQATFSMSCFAVICCTIVLAANLQFVTCFGFLHRHPQALLHLAVLSLCSTLTQFLISYTIKYFGPVTFVIIATSRQVISVCLSSVLFKHNMPPLAWIAAALVFSTVIQRSVSKLNTLTSLSLQDQRPLSEQSGSLDWVNISFMPRWASTTSYRLILCVLGIHIPLCFWAVAQEFMVTHTYEGKLFPSGSFIVALNRVIGVLFASFLVKFQGKRFWSPQLRLVPLPAATNLAGTLMQYQALYYISFPEQTLMKTVKVIPVMLISKVFKNRMYSVVDYTEAALITCISLLLVWYFEVGEQALSFGNKATTGFLLMVGYIIADSASSNLEDIVYQVSQIDPVQMLLGSELCSALFSLAFLIVKGQLHLSLNFLCQHPQALMHLILLAIFAFCGAYASSVTLKLFSPALFALLMMSRQTLSLVISVFLFGHKVDMMSCACLVVLSMLILTSCLRRAITQKQLDDVKANS